MYNIDKKEIIRTFKLFYTGGSSMKKIRNILAMLMVFVMLVAVMPMNVFAEGDETADGTGKTSIETETQDESTNPKNQDESTNPKNQDESTNPKNQDESTNPKNQDESKDPKNQDESKDPKNQDESTDPKNTDDTEKPAKEAKYTIKINKADNGTVTANDGDTKLTGDTKLAEGTEITLTIDPKTGYKLTKLDVKAGNNPVTLTKNEEKEKAFKMPAANVTITATFDVDKKTDDKPDTPPAPAAKTYDIYPKTVGNGTVTISAEKSEAGKTITVNATPKYGYVVDSIVVTNVRTDESVYKRYTHMSYFNDYPYYLGSRWYRGYDYDDYISWCNGRGYSRYDYSSFKRWCNWNGYSYDYDDFKRFCDWDDIYDYGWYNRYDYSYYDQAEFTMPADHVTVTVTFTSAPYWYDGYYYDYETGTYRRYYGDDYYYYRYRRNKKDNYYERQKKAEEKAKKEEEEAKAKAEAAKQPQIYENKAVISIGSNVLDKVSKNVHTVHQMDAPAYVNGGRVMLPLRFVAEALGLQVSWVPETKTVIIWDLTQRVEIPVKSNRIIVNGITYTSDVKPEIKSSRTMLPIANIARALGLIDGSDIIWDQYNKQVTLTRKVLSK